MLLLRSNFCQSFGQIFCQSFLLKRNSVDLCLFCSKSAHGLRTRSNSIIHHIYPIFWYHAKQNPAVIGKGHGRRGKRAPHSWHDLVQWRHEQWQLGPYFVLSRVCCPEDSKLRTANSGHCPELGSWAGPGWQVILGRPSVSIGLL